MKKKVKILENFKGAIDGITVIEYKKGEVLGVPKAFFNTFGSRRYEIIENPEVEIEKTEIEELETKVVVPEETKVVYTEDELNIMKLPKLKKIAKSLDVERYYNKKAEVLIKEILKKV